MPRTEVLTSSWITLLDRHVRIAEANDDNLARRILDVDSTLLALARCVERIVQRHLLALIKVTFLGEGGFQNTMFAFSTDSTDSTDSTGLKSSAI